MAGARGRQDRGHWVFDLDGTLVDSFESYFKALKAIYAARGLEFKFEFRHDSLTRPIQDIFAEKLGPRAVESAMRELQIQSNDDARTIRPFDGIPAVLDGLRGCGARLDVWTNRDLESAELIIKHTGLSRYVEMCVSGTCVARKPDPAGLRRIMEAFNCGAGEVTVVGDHEFDVRAPKTVGARSVRASWHPHWPMPPCEYADAQFYSVADFSAWLTGADGR